MFVALLLLLTLPMCALSEIIAVPSTVEFSNGKQIDFVKIALEAGTVKIAITGNDGRMILQKGKYINAYQANITVGGKTLKWKSIDTLGSFYIYSFKSKKMPESVTIIKKGVLGSPDETRTITLTDTDALPAGKSVVIDQFVVQLITSKEAFKGKGNLTTTQADTHIGGDIMLKGSSMPRSVIKRSQEGKTMLLVPLSVNMAFSDAADSPTKILLSAKLADGTALYDLWYDASICVLMFDTQAYTDKELIVEVRDGVLTFEAMP